ncbi:MAG: potassium-transporting ATPase subunit [Dehalococcoidia bacterium]|nr:potassium-transporting ATPase subunit [Dehalococcoidia bacterium]
MRKNRQQARFEKGLLKRALWDSLLLLDPRKMVRNPVMFVVEVSAVLTTGLWIQALAGQGEAKSSFIGAVSIWLWFTLLFANFSQAVAEGRGRARANALRSTRQDTEAKKLRQPNRESPYETVPASMLHKGDMVLVEAGDLIPGDGEIVEGVASVDESAVTGESAPVIRESGGDRNGVTGGTRVLSDWLIVRIVSGAGEGFLDQMIALVEGAKRKKTPNEIALNILLAAFTIVFLVVCATLLPFSIFSTQASGAGSPVTITVLVALLVCLIPTTIGGLLPAIGISGMERLIRRNVIAMSGRAVEAAGDVDVLLLDKTGTMTLGNRRAVDFVPLSSVALSELAETSLLASLADETPEGRSIVSLAREKYGIVGGEDQGQLKSHGPEGMRFIPFTAHSRMSGVDAGGVSIRKGAADAIESYVRAQGQSVPEEVHTVVENIARGGGTPLVVARNGQVLGVIHLKDVVKTGIRERFIQLRKMGIKTVMITGDNPLTAAAIAAEAGVDDFLAQVTPESKLRLIREVQAEGRLVAMTGDGTNDAPALAQADVAVAMHTGTHPAREAANMIDLDSNPTKLIEIVETGKQLLMTRGALTTFSIANDVSKYFAIVPAAFAATYPALGALNILRLSTPENAILSAVIFNALIIVFLIPLALRGVPYRPVGAARLLRDNILIYGLGGVVVPFIGIKLIDMLLSLLERV